MFDKCISLGALLLLPAMLTFGYLRHTYFPTRITVVPMTYQTWFDKQGRECIEVHDVYGNKSWGCRHG